MHGSGEGLEVGEGKGESGLATEEPELARVTEARAAATKAERLANFCLNRVWNSKC